jgi:YD repeat-containing protein
VGNLFRTGEQGDRKYGPGEHWYKVWEYHWNALGMLTRVLRPDGREVSFEYDPFCRRLRKKIDNKTTHWVWDGNVPLHDWVAKEASQERPWLPRNRSPLRWFQLVC